jgi:hypothetical protein
MWIVVGHAGVIRTATTGGPTGTPASWTTRTAPESNSWRGIAESSTRLVAVANSGTNRIMTSTDGVTWASVTGVTAANYTGVAYSPELNLFVATSVGTVVTSSDGLTWTAISGANNNITWYSELGMFMGDMMYSFNGINWFSNIVTHGSGGGGGTHCPLTHHNRMICPSNTGQQVLIR